MSNLYPIKFSPILKHKIWGGTKIESALKRDLSGFTKVGESFDVSGLEGNVSVVANGFLKGNSLNELLEVYMGDFVGEAVYEKYGNEFPLLVKIIDAYDDLSVQVHPNDEIAAKYHNGFGKTEMWYVLDAEDGAGITFGFDKHIDKDVFVESITNGTVMDNVQHLKVSKGDIYFIPAGCMHSIGKGCLMLEIQQTSDLTYRIYDYDRKDDYGQLRELHIDRALEALNFECVQPKAVDVAASILNSVHEVIACDYFSINLIHADTRVERDYNDKSSCVLLSVVEGIVRVMCNGENTELVKGDTVLIPSEITILEIIPVGQSKILETFIN